MTKSNPLVLPYSAGLFWLLVASAVVLSVFYMLSVSESIFNVARREELNRSIAEKANEVASLEARYLAKTQEVTHARALELGFVNAPRKTFASRVDLSPTLSFSGSAGQ